MLGHALGRRSPDMECPILERQNIFRNAFDGRPDCKNGTPNRSADVVKQYIQHIEPVEHPPYVATFESPQQHTTVVDRLQRGPYITRIHL